MLRTAPLGCRESCRQSHQTAGRADEHKEAGSEDLADQGHGRLEQIRNSVDATCTGMRRRTRGASHATRQNQPMIRNNIPKISIPNAIIEIAAVLSRIVRGPRALSAGVSVSPNRRTPAVPTAENTTGNNCISIPRFQQSIKPSHPSIAEYDPAMSAA